MTLVSPKRHGYSRGEVLLVLPIGELEVMALGEAVDKFWSPELAFRLKEVEAVPSDHATREAGRRNALQRAGIENFRWHDLRHTFATWHREAGTPTYELQRQGGWKDQSMVERYAHIAPEGLQLAAARLDRLVAPVP